MLLRLVWLSPIGRHYSMVSGNKAAKRVLTLDVVLFPPFVFFGRGVLIFPIGKYQFGIGLDDCLPGQKGKGNQEF